MHQHGSQWRKAKLMRLLLGPSSALTQARQIAWLTGRKPSTTQRQSPAPHARRTARSESRTAMPGDTTGWLATVARTV